MEQIYTNISIDEERSIAVSRMRRMCGSVGCIEAKANNSDSAKKSKYKKQKQMYFVVCESCF